MNATTLLTVAVVVIGGMLLSTQGPINASLGNRVGDPIAAAMISFGVGFAILVAVTIARGAVPTIPTLVALPWWAWVGGALGAYYVFAILWAVPRVGVLTVATATIFGQLTMALVLDAIGALWGAGTTDKLATRRGHRVGAFGDGADARLTGNAA